MDLSIAATDAVGWTATTGTIPANTHHLSFSATNSYIATIIAVSSTGGTMDTATALFSNEIIAGLGWSGPTPVPPIQGNPTMNGFIASESAIATFDVVPLQVIDTTFGIGVIADQPSGISHVDIAVNGGDWVTFTSPTPNLQTANIQDNGIDTDATGNGVYVDGIVEYWGTLRAISGVMTARFRAYPNQGTPLVGEVVLYGNADGSYDRTPLYVATTGNDTTGDGTFALPFLTIRRATKEFNDTVGNCDHCTIYLKAGDYDYAGTYASIGSNISGWLTITPAPGLTYDQVRIVSSTSGNQLSNSYYVRLKNLTVYNCAIRQDSGNNKQIWFDGVYMHSAALHDGGQGFYTGWDGGAYYTDFTISHCNVACEFGPIARNGIIDNISEDAFRAIPLIVNCRISNVTKITEHPDVWQSADYINNVIVYGLQATDNVNAQGWTGLSMTNSAWIKSNIFNPSPWPFWLQAIRINTMFRESVIGEKVTVSNSQTDSDHPASWYNLISSYDNFSIDSTITMTQGGSPDYPTIGTVPGWTED